MTQQERNGLNEAAEISVHAAGAVRGAIKTGKAVSGAAKGAAAAGPYGAAAAALWTHRKAVVAIIAGLLAIPVLFIMLLPSLIFGGLTQTGSEGNPDSPILNDNTAIVENINQISQAISDLLEEGLEDVRTRIDADFGASSADQKEIVNPYESSPAYNANRFIAMYCAAKDQDYERQEGEQTLIYRMMDRNLGANDPTGSGDKSRSCLYQWGRKDPFSNATTVYGPEGNTLDMHSWPSCEGYTIDPVWNAQIGRKSGDYLYNGTVEFTLSHPATYISYADEKDISNPNQTWLRSDVPGHQNDRLWGTYFEKEAVGAATVLLSKSAFDPCPAGYRIPLIAPLKFTGNDVESYTTEGVWLYVDSQRSVKAWYPYAGSRFSKMDASGKQIGILGYTEGASGLYQFSYAASIWSATLEFVQEISVGTSCNSDDLTVTGYSSTGYRPEFVYEGPYARSFALAVRCVREDANGIVR